MGTSDEISSLFRFLISLRLFTAQCNAPTTPIKQGGTGGKKRAGSLNYCTPQKYPQVKIHVIDDARE